VLRSLRTDRGWTVEYVAEQLLCSPSKISRLETGQRGVSPRDIRDLCDLYSVEDSLRRQLSDLAAEGKQQAWWQSRGLPYSTYVGLESEAGTIRDFGYGVVPGLLQTADYAEAVLRTIHPVLRSDEIGVRLSGRIERQQRLLESGSPPRFESVIDEAVLHRVAGNNSVMRTQLLHLVEVSRRQNVSVRLLPYEVGVLPATNNKFILLSFAESPVPAMVFIEGLSGDLYLDKPEDVEIYRDAFTTMQAIALTEGRTRDAIARIADEFALR
jgi:transcriptional regulator with XRE-family HTH domain